MVCRNCGSRIPDGKLYCPFCGEEVQLVPEYNSTDMQRVMKHMEEEEQERLRREKELEEEENRRRRRMSPEMKLLSVLIIALLSAAFSLCMIFLIKRANHENFGYLRVQAARAAESGDTAEALQYLVQAEAVMPPASIGLSLDKSGLLWELGQKDNAKATLYGLLTKDRSLPVYEQLIAYLAEDGENDRIAALVADSGNEELIETYGAYIANPPEFSLMNGDTYAYGTMLTITVTGKGKIYYTTDGTDPSDSAFLYEEPVMLEMGTNRIRSVFINEKGVRSPESAAVYNVIKAETKAA